MIKPFVLEQKVDALRLSQMEHESEAHLVHLLPVGFALLVDEVEEGRDREQIVLDDMQILDEVQRLGLSTPLQHQLHQCVLESRLRMGE